MVHPSGSRHLRRTVSLAAVTALLVACGSPGPTGAPPASGAPPVESVAASIAATLAATPAITPRPSGDVGVVEVPPLLPKSIRATEAYGIVPIDQVIVKLKPGLGRADAEALAAEMGGSVTGEIDIADLYTIGIAATDESGLSAALAKARGDARVALAAPNQANRMEAGESDIWGVRTSPIEDPVYAGQAADGYRMIGVPAAWEYIRGSGMRLGPANVGIVDTGLYQGTGEFAGDTQVTYTDPDASLASPEPVKYNNGTAGPPDPAGGHGTSANVLVGANAKNGGTVGIASPIGSNLHISNTNLYGPKYTGTAAAAPASPDPSNPAVQQWGQYGTYSFGDLAAITAELKNKPAGQPKVINLSWGTADWTKTDPDLVQVYRDYFTQVAKDYPDVIFVVAAGNDGQKMDGAKYYPAGFALPNMITVGNVSNDGKVWKESNTANTDPGHEFEVTVFAPGEESVRGYDPSTGTVTKTSGGTSMAAPQVTATIALLQSLNPKLTPDEIKKLIVASARKGPDGQPILAVDEAVFAVLDINCHVEGKEPCPTKEEMANRGAIDAVATPLKDAPGEYLVRGIVQAVSPDGTPVRIAVEGGKVTKGETPRTLTAPGELGWTVAMDGDKGTVTVTRTDNGAGSVITIEKIDINGTWSGTFTVTSFDIDPELVKMAKEEGCTEGNFKEIVGKPLPMTMTIKVDESGNGTAVTTIDLSALKDAKGKPLSAKPATSKIAYAGNQVRFIGDSGTIGGSMTGYVSRTGDVVSMKGTSTAKDSGISMKATWNVVQGG